jgi:hypothetical protein
MSIEEKEDEKYNYLVTSSDVKHQHKNRAWRPLGYYYKLFSYHRFNENSDKIKKLVKEAIKLLKDNPKELIKRIMNAHILQCEVSEEKEESWYNSLNEEEKKEYFLFEREEPGLRPAEGSAEQSSKQVTVVKNDVVENFIESWEDFDYLPKRKKKPKTFEELFEVMLTYNPHWLLEVYAFSYSNGDFSRVEPRGFWYYKLKGGKVTREEIVKNLYQEYLS